MKKNAMLKIAAILMVAVLLTTCAISSTFAKYVASGSDSTEARVAKWGVSVDSEIFTTAPLFAKEYGESGKHVLASNNDLLVAPGTKQSISVDSVVDGTPEVSGKVVVTASFTLGDGWVDGDGAFYCPLVITAGGDSVKFTEKGTKSVEKTFTFEPNEALDDKVTFDVAWEWAFTDTTDEDATAERDAKDTWLADHGTPTITVDLTIAIEQTGAAVE